ncbi:wHTH domain-containing protein [Micromonospora chokoriensis]
MTNRSALLIGVPSCDNDLFAAIPEVVTADVQRMRDVLLQSGYAVTCCGVDDRDGKEPTGNRIAAAMKQAFREAPSDGILLIYFSGHGVVVDGHSWLVPKDAYAGPDGPDTEGLVPLVPTGVEQCPARLVLLLVDACRNDLSGQLTAPARGHLPFPPAGALVLMNSCSPGERSLYGPEGSYFTGVVADVLDYRFPARTFREVEQAVIQRVGRVATRVNGMQQSPETLVAGRIGRTAIDDIEICNGDQVSETWRQVAQQSPLWRRSSVDREVLDQVRRAVLETVDACARDWLDARERLSDRAGLNDAWSTPDYPARVLANLTQLLPADTELSTAELAAAITVPFLRECALNAGLRLAAGISPQDFTRTFEDGPRNDLEITHSMHEHMWRRAEGLARRNRSEARDALAMWLVHRWLATRSSLWTDAAVVTLIGRLADGVNKDTGLTSGELCELIRVLMQTVDADASDELLTSQLAKRLFDPRLRTLGAMLWLAGITAADPRRMPSVVVDHIGVQDEVTVTELQRATRQMSWRSTGGELSLQAVCAHPAIYAAFEGVARRAEQARAAIAGIDLHEGMAGGLPAAITTDGLRPEHKDGVPLFDTPPMEFRLSADKVRELLMGRQLYGEPDLAVRELYQNALDACRYRHTRREYRRVTSYSVAAWSGTITIRQGTKGGRQFIECADNGVGMSRSTLTSTFANAGERFVYGSAFRAEQALWEVADPPLRLIPNSQFGIGVFSYFMIAEEIEIWTRPIGVDDVPEGQAYHVRIASSGSLFQITQCHEMTAGGTIVRLWLTGEDPISVRRTMRRLLWLAEFRVEVTEDDGTETWEPDQLRFSGATVAPLRHGEDLWWVPGEGGLLADGIRTSEERYGLLVNLRGRHRPQFTVDRNRLRRWDREWINSEVHESLPALSNWPGLTLNWLWKVTEKSPEIAEAVFEWLVTHDRDITIEGSWVHGRSAPIQRIGCLPVDQELFTGELRPRRFYNDHMWLLTWRIGAWRDVVHLPGWEQVPVAACLDGHPLARPLDAAVVHKIYEWGDRYRAGGRFGAPTVEELLLTAADEYESPIDRLKRLRRFAIAGLDLSAARQIPPISCRFHDHERPPNREMEHAGLLPAVPAWAPPGTPAREAVGGWLAVASNALNAPVREVLRRVNALVPRTWTPPDLTGRTELLDHVFRPAETSLFSAGLYNGPPWIGADVPPTHVMKASTSLGKSVTEILQMFERFAPLGYRIIGRDQYPPDLQPVENAALAYVEVIPQQLTPLQVFVLAGQLSLTVRQVRQGLDRLVEAGLVLLPEHEPLPDATPSEMERSILNEQLMVYNFRKQALVLSEGWTAVFLLAAYIGPPKFGGFVDRLTSARRLLQVVAPARSVSTPEIVDLSYRLDLSIADSIDHYRLLFEDAADVSALPAEAFNCDVACHRTEEFVALLGNYERAYHGDHTVNWSLRAGDYAYGAATARQSIPAFLDRLEPYRSLGAPLPALTNEEIAQLDAHMVDRHDVTMLHRTDSYGLDHPVDVVTPLWLLQISGRFGWTVLEARSRMARFEPLGLEVQCQAQHCPDSIVDWRDLLVLTTHLDGQAPVLAGPVTPEHLHAAAAEISESTADVVGRLARYAKLFDYTLEGEHGDG